MTKQGRAGEALAIAAIGSFIAGTAGALFLSFAAPLLAEFSLAFGSPEYFGLMFFSLTALFSFSGRDLLRSVSAGLAGIVMATVGIDPLSGTQRMAFGIPQFLSGFDVIPVLIGLFGVAEVLYCAEEQIVSVYQGKLGRLLPRGKEMAKGLWASIQGSGGSALIFLQRPFCAAFIFLGLLLILMSRTLYSKVSIQEEADGSK